MDNQETPATLTQVFIDQQKIILPMQKYICEDKMCVMA
jgi:hypothetical protein